MLLPFLIRLNVFLTLLLKTILILNLYYCFATKGCFNGVWLGFSDVQREGYMVAISDRSRPLYSNWIKGQPDNSGGNEHCAVYWTARTAWNDIPCSGKVHFVCTRK